MLNTTTPEDLDNYQLWQQLRYGDVLPDPQPMFNAQPSERLSTAEDNYIYSLLQPANS